MTEQEKRLNTKELEQLKYSPDIKSIITLPQNMKSRVKCCDHEEKVISQINDR